MINKKINITWEGSLFTHHSLAMVNREILLCLLNYDRLKISHVSYEQNQFEPKNRFIPLVALGTDNTDKTDIYIRHRWPPVFTRKGNAKNILFQPWEYGSIPENWIDPINNNIDEIWAYTNFVKDTYIRAGINKELVHVIPLGINPTQFNLQHSPAKWIQSETEGTFRFLFIGGINTRKGTDILINAFLNEFKKEENVSLVIKESPFYNTKLAEQIKILSKRNDIPKILFTEENIAPGELPGIYHACDCYVHPYRAEGYGLPIAEAMACGLPVIVTGSGSCLDFTNRDLVYYINAEKKFFPKKKAANLETVDYPFWYEPDMWHLGQLMRLVYNERENAVKKGIKAASYIQKHHLWSHGAQKIMSRIENLK